MKRMWTTRFCWSLGVLLVLVWGSHSTAFGQGGEKIEVSEPDKKLRVPESRSRDKMFEGSEDFLRRRGELPAPVFPPPKQDSRKMRALEELLKENNPWDSAEEYDQDAILKKIFQIREYDVLGVRKKNGMEEEEVPERDSITFDSYKYENSVFDSLSGRGKKEEEGFRGTNEPVQGGNRLTNEIDRLSTGFEEEDASVSGFFSRRNGMRWNDLSERFGSQERRAFDERSSFGENELWGRGRNEWGDRGNGSDEEMSRIESLIHRRFPGAASGEFLGALDPVIPSQNTTRPQLNISPLERESELFAKPESAFGPRKSNPLDLFKDDALGNSSLAPAVPTTGRPTIDARPGILEIPRRKF